MIPNSASLRDPRALTRSLPVDFATLHPSGCLRQSFSLRSIILPCRAPCGSLIRSFQLLTLAGLLMQSFSAIASIPERLPKPPGSRESSLIVALHVASLLRYAPVDSLLRCAPVESFAPAQLIRRISRPAPPSELPCGSLSSTFPKGLDSPFGPTFG